MRRFVFAVGLVCLAASAHADDDCYTQIILKNKTGMKLKLTYVVLEWGKWDVGPPIDVAKGQEILYKASGKTPSPTGTEGKLHYSLMTDEGAETGMVYVHEWNLSYRGSTKDKQYANHHGFKLTDEYAPGCKQTSHPISRCWGCQHIYTLTRTP